MHPVELVRGCTANEPPDGPELKSRRGKEDTQCNSAIVSRQHKPTSHFAFGETRISQALGKAIFSQPLRSWIRKNSAPILNSCESSYLSCYGFLNRFDTGLTSPNSHDLLKTRHENLAVPNLARPRRLTNGVDGAVDLVVVDNNF